ncbi:nucleotide modification associated domain-containing protein [Flavonifractor plautii]|jgi:hypothetical protein|nr:nucleotide modification associated domain-containing protein [Flavonifractor plautii]MDB7958207.1 nucleotide modification associated domain-containing protein [Flavonifractor plautii]
MLENEIRHAAICEEINRAYKQGAGEEFHETFHGFRDRNDAIKMSRSLLGLNLDMFKKMSRIRDFEAARSALVALANQAMMVIIELDGKPTEEDNHWELCRELQELYHRKNLDYGDSFHLSFLEEGLAMPRIRLGDKYLRFKTLTSGEKQRVSDESIRDTLIDLANYSIMTIMELDQAMSTNADKREAFLRAAERMNRVPITVVEV